MNGLRLHSLFDMRRYIVVEVFNHQPRKVGMEVQRRINALGIGQKMQDLPEELWHKSFRYYVKEDPSRKGGPNLRMIRLDPDQPSLTVTGYIFNKFVHPYEDRFITPREAARLQGFPDDLEFKGVLTSVQSQVGDAVPIELGRSIFESLMILLKKHWPKKKIFKTLSLFSGAGGLDIASERIKFKDNSHFELVACIEIEEDRCDTLKGYFKDKVKVFNVDISEVTTDTLLSTCKVSKDDIWVIYGGPPCQSFSQAGKQKGTDDSRGILVFEFIRFLKEINPPYFVMENVANINGIEKGFLLKKIVQKMNKIGYNVESGILNSVDYGNAQKRRRFICLGSKKGWPIAKLPLPTHCEQENLLGLPLFKTVGEALEGLPSPECEKIALENGKDL